MEPRERPTIAMRGWVPGGPDRLPVEAHADLTGHSGAYSHSDRGWECAVCTNLAGADPYFTAPASGPPPSGYFETWAANDYIWRAEHPPFIVAGGGSIRPEDGYRAFTRGRRPGR